MTACMTPVEIVYPWDKDEVNSDLASYERLPVPAESEFLPNGMRAVERATFDGLPGLKLNAGRK